MYGIRTIRLANAKDRKEGRTTLVTKVKRTGT